MKATLSWEGSPWGSGAIQAWAFCRNHDPRGETPARFFGQSWGSKMQFGGRVQLLTAHRLIDLMTVTERRRFLTDLGSRCSREFQRWQGLFDSKYRPTPFAFRSWRSLVIDTGPDPTKLEIDAAKASLVVACVLRQEWGDVKLMESPATSHTTFRFGDVRLPVTTFFDFEFEHDVVDLKCTQVEAYGTREGVIAHLQSDLQAAIHWQICDDLGQRYHRLYYIMDAQRGVTQLRRHLVEREHVALGLARLHAGVDARLPLPTLNPRSACHSCTLLDQCVADAVQTLEGEVDKGVEGR